MPPCCSAAIRPIPTKRSPAGRRPLALPAVRGLDRRRTLLYPPTTTLRPRCRRPWRWCADHAQHALPGRHRHPAVHRRRHAGIGGLGRIIAAGTGTGFPPGGGPAHRRHRGDDPAAGRRQCRRVRRGVSELARRASVSTVRPTWCTSASVSSTCVSGAGRFRSAGCGHRSFPNRRLRRRRTMPVELRGAGNRSRQVHNFGTATTFEADRLIACEVITPGGNWSSYPAHKHDEDSEIETQLRGDLLTSRSTRAPGQRGIRLSPGTAHRSAPIEVLERCAAATSCWCRTGTGPPSRRPATTCTTST